MTAIKTTLLAKLLQLQCTVFCDLHFVCKSEKVFVSLSLPYLEWLGHCFRAKHSVSIGKYFCWQIMGKMCFHTPHRQLLYVFKYPFFHMYVPLFVYVWFFFVCAKKQNKNNLNKAHGRSYHCSLICFKDLNIYSSYVVATWGNMQANSFLICEYTNSTCTKILNAFCVVILPCLYLTPQVKTKPLFVFHYNCH